MSRLGDFLEVVFGSSAPFKTVHASIRHWRNVDLADLAGDNKYPGSGRRKVRTIKDLSPTPRLYEGDLTVWWSLPDRVRIETVKRTAEGNKTSLIVANGERSWTRDHLGHVEIEDHDRRHRHEQTEIERHFGRDLLHRILAGLHCKPMARQRLLVANA
jgi:hypothetical protein